MHFHFAVQEFALEVWLYSSCPFTQFVSSVSLSMAAAAAALPTASVRDLLTDVMVLVVEVKAEIAVAQIQLQKLDTSLDALKKALGLENDQSGTTRARSTEDSDEEREHKRQKQVYQTKKEPLSPTESLGSPWCDDMNGKDNDGNYMGPTIPAALPNDESMQAEATLIQPH